VAQARELGIDPASGKPMTVRMGRFGPFVQIGTKDDADKPRFAGLRPGQKMDTITFDEAMELFKLPRKLGVTAAGEEMVANVGRFGPYVKYGAKYVSLKTDDPYTVTHERALEVIREKEIADANRLILDFPDAGIQVLNGRYGPYITDKSRNAKIPKDRDPKSVSLEECQALLAAAPQRTFGKWGRKGKAANGKTAANGKATPTAGDTAAKAPKGIAAKTNGKTPPGANTAAKAPHGVGAKPATSLAVAAAKKKSPAKAAAPLAGLPAAKAGSPKRAPARKGPAKKRA
jgi:DNA topoisomerase-1